MTTSPAGADSLKKISTVNKPAEKRRIPNRIMSAFLIKLNMLQFSIQAARFEGLNCDSRAEIKTHRQDLLSYIQQEFTK